MATTTPNLSLTKPAGSDAADIAVINANMDILDNAVTLTGAQTLSAKTLTSPHMTAPVVDAGGLVVTGGITGVNLLAVASNVLGADVLLNNTSNYFDGPSMAQGTVGTWWVSGTVTLTDTGANALLIVKLWDGVTVIASTDATNVTAAGITSVTLSGLLATPAGNIRISVKDPSSTTGKILFNSTANSKDSAIFGVRIG